MRVALPEDLWNRAAHIEKLRKFFAMRACNADTHSMLKGGVVVASSHVASYK